MDLIARLEKTYTGVVHDVMLELGFRGFTLPPTIRPLSPGQVLAGEASTVSGRVDTSADRHATLLGWTGLLSKARGGTVLVCQPNDSQVAHMGELSAETLTLEGVRGYVVDGGCRDVDFILKLGFPVWCRYFTPRDIARYWLPESFDEPVRIGEVTIHPGDLVLGDRDGMVVLPKDGAEEIVAKAEEATNAENLVRKAILEGVDPQEAYLRHGRF